MTNHKDSPFIWGPKYLLCLVFLIPALPGCSAFSDRLQKDSPDVFIEAHAAPDTPLDNRQDAYEKFMSASIAMYSGRFNEARNLMTIAIANDPESPFLNGRMAMLLKRLKQYNEASLYAKKCVELDTDNVQYRILLADIYSLLGQDALAAEQYAESMKLDPKNERIRLLIVTLLVKEKKFDAALSQLDDLISKFPDLAIAHYYRGKICMELKNFDAAEISLLKTLEIDSGQELAMFDLATLYQMTGRNLEASQTYENLIEYQPDNTALRIKLINLYSDLGLHKKVENQIEEIKRSSDPGDEKRQLLGLIYLKQGRLAESIDEMETIVTRYPEGDKPRYYLAIAYQENKEYKKALEHFRMINPNSSYFYDAVVHIAYLLDKQNKSDDAVTVLEKALSQNKKLPDLYLMLADLYEKQKQMDNAISILKQSLIHNENEVSLIFRLGILMDKNGDRKSCLEQMLKIIQINPDHSDALNYVGYTYAEEGIKLDEAQDLIEKAIKLNPNAGYIQDSMGWVLYQKGKYDEAVEYLEKALKNTPDDPTIHEHLGDVFLKLKKYADALAFYKKSLTLQHPDEEKIIKKISELEQLLDPTNKDQ